MLREIETLVAGFEHGTLTRRHFVQGLLAATAGAAGAAPPQARTLNHVSLAVADVDASQRFYERVLGMAEISRQPNGVNLGLGDSFLGLYDIRPPGGIHHFCIGVDDYVIDRTAEQLRAHGIEPRIRQDRPELYFTDPDGITVQLSETEYRG